MKFKRVILLIFLALLHFRVNSQDLAERVFGLSIPELSKRKAKCEKKFKFEVFQSKSNIKKNRELLITYSRMLNAVRLFNEPSFVQAFDSTKYLQLDQRRLEKVVLDLIYKVTISKRTEHQLTEEFYIKFFHYWIISKNELPIKDYILTGKQYFPDIIFELDLMSLEFEYTYSKLKENSYKKYQKSTDIKKIEEVKKRENVKKREISKDTREFFDLVKNKMTNDDYNYATLIMKIAPESLYLINLNEKKFNSDKIEKGIHIISGKEYHFSVEHNNKKYCEQKFKVSSYDIKVIDCRIK